MIRRYKRELSVAAALAILAVILLVGAPSFFGRDNLRAFRVSNAPVLVAAIGMTLVILARHIDISIGSQFSICGVAAGMLAKQGVPAPVVALAVLALGGGFGAINGFLVAGLRLPSIVVTLATMVTWREGLRWQRQGQFVNLPDGVQWFGLTQAVGQWTLIITALLVLVFMAVGMKDPVLGPTVMAALRQQIRGCPSPLEIPNGGHFVQEWGKEIAEAAVSAFA